MSNKELACALPSLNSSSSFQRAVVCRPLEPALLHILVPGRLARRRFFWSGERRSCRADACRAGFARGRGQTGSGFSFLLDQMTREDAAPQQWDGSPPDGVRRARTSGLSADVHMLPHLSSEILIWMANSPSFVRGALSPLAGVQCCNEQQLARRPVLRSGVPLPDECVICCLFSTRFCSASNRPRTHPRPVCVTHLAMALSSRLGEKKV